MDLRELWQPNPEAIRRLRRERGWSRFQLAGHAGVSPHTVTRAEKGYALFPTTLRLIAQALNKPREELCLYARDTSDLTPEMGRRLKQIFREVAAFDSATLNVDAELAREELYESCHEDVVLSLAVTGGQGSVAKTIQGIPAVVKHFDATNRMLRRTTPVRFDEIRPVGAHQFLCTAIDRMWDLTLNTSASGFCVYLFTFREDRIAVIQGSITNVAANGDALGPALPQQIGLRKG